MQKLAKHEAEVAKKGGGGGSLDALGNYVIFLLYMNSQILFSTMWR
jgi:hypothetical protein